MVIGGIVVTAGILYGGFILADTGNGSFSRIPSASMAPAILDGDYLTWRPIDRLPDGEPKVERGDLIVHAWPPDRSKQFIKRLVGLPGDTIEMKDGTLFVNNRPLSEPYAHHDEPTIDPVVDEFDWQRQYLVGHAAADPSKYKASKNNWGPLLVPRDHYFVLGDNRDNSLDSRYWGFLARADVQGRVRRVYFSRDSTGRIRWSRIGERLQ
jgi:signal peptidase I